MTIFIFNLQLGFKYIYFFLPNLIFQLYYNNHDKLKKQKTQEHE